MIKINNLTVIKNNQSILSDVSLEFNNNELVCIVGHSGAGKTTLINEILDNQQNEFMQTTLTNEEIAPIFQEFNIFPRLNTITNVLIGKIHLKRKLDALFLDFSKDEKNQAIKYLEKVGLAKFANKKAKELSGGEKQRVAIARALYQEAKLIIADEPTSSLDIINANEIMKIFYNYKNDRLIICVIHDLNLAFKYADRIILVDNGKIKFDGKNNPSNQTKILKYYEKN